MVLRVDPFATCQLSQFRDTNFMNILTLLLLQSEAALEVTHCLGSMLKVQVETPAIEETDRICRFQAHAVLSQVGDS